MANTKFDSKSFNPEAFGAYVDRIPNLKKNELLQSKALTPNAQIRGAFSSQSGTAYARIPLYGLLGGEPANYDGQTDITSDTTVTYERGVVVTGRAKSWTEKDFSHDIASTDFMDNVASQIADYWADVDQDILLSILKGIFTMTGAENKKFVDGHTYDITSGTVKEDQVVASTTLNKAIHKACGDNKSRFSIVIMHSDIATNLENIKLLKYMTQTDADGITRDLTLAAWNGRVVLIDDSMPIEEVKETAEGALDGYLIYTTYILGECAFDYEDIGAKVPFEMQRDPKTNGGEDTLYSRQRKVFAPYGISYEKKSQVSLSPTSLELEKGANWTLVSDGGSNYINQKAIPIARIISRG